jgi:inner membrane protein
MAALPFAVTGLVLMWDRLVRRRRDPSAPAVRTSALLLVSILGVLSHPALDWLNTYGIRLLMPFTSTWYRGDTLFIIDPWLWLVLSLGLLLARNAQPDAKRVRRLTSTSGFLALAYICSMLALSVAGKRMGAAVAAASGIQGVTEVLYSPRFGNPLQADLLARTNDAYYPGAIEWRFSPARVLFAPDSIPRGEWNAPAVMRARAAPAVRNYLTWSQFPYVRVDVQGADTTVFFGDARYRGRIGASLGGFDVPLSSVR